MNLADIIKQCSMDAFEATVPCDVVFGSVVEVEPVKVEIGDLKIGEELLLVAEHLKHREEEVTFGVYERTIVINEGLAKGDVLVLLRKKGGESYVALGKLM